MRSMIWLMLAAAATSVSAADVYKSVAADGTVVYSDRPTSSDAEPVFVATSRSAARAPARPAQPSAVPAADAARAQPAAGSQAAEQTPAETAATRARNCDTARERNESYRTSRRLYRTLPNGEREYLNDAEIDEARARAAADVETWCS